MSPLTIAVTGLNATDSPAPGVPVIRAIRAAAGDNCRIVGLAYDPLDPGNFMPDIADAVFLMPYPSQGADVLFQRLTEIYQRVPFDVILPTLDAELPAYLKILDRLHALGIRTFLPTPEQLNMRSKAKLYELKTEYGIDVPLSTSLLESRAISTLSDDFRFPVMVKGQFYDAVIAYSPMDVEAHFQRIKGKWGLPVVIQEFISGTEYDVVCVGDGEGGVTGAVAMRKMQLTDKGKAWGGITISDPALDRFVARVIRTLNWRGPAEIEVIKEQDSGKFYLIEVNPRFPAWVYLSVGAENNLPWATVALALQQPVQPLPPPEPGIMFIRHSYDLICSLADYQSLTTDGELIRERNKR